MIQLVCRLRFVLGALALAFVALSMVSTTEARNITEYRNLLTDSAPLAPSNHTLSFVLNTDVSPGAHLEVTPPTGFEILATSTFGVRNVELSVNGVRRTASTTPSATRDGVTITPGSPGKIRYTLNPIVGLEAGDRIELRIGNHTSNARTQSFSYSSTTGTTTNPGDVEPILNASAPGTHEVDLLIYDGGVVADAGFLIAVVERVGVGPADTTETVPPYRFNPAPTSTVGGTTLSVEISLETDELAVCKYDTVAGTAYSAMPNTFSNSGFLFHSQVVAITPNSVQRFYVRCIDDEGNFNTDDFLIIFTVNDVPSGTANEQGNVSGDGTGSGNDGTGDGSGTGGTTGDSNGVEPEQGGSSGSGGSGGGGGGSRGEDTEDESGGGFESTDEAYESGDGRVIISGSAFPNSTVVALVDGNVAESVTANSTGRYSVTLDAIARGVYTFGVFGVDDDGVRSSTFSTSFTVTGARTTSLSNINVMPSISVDPDPVEVGQTVTISGFSIPNATVSIENEKDGSSVSRKSYTATSNANGEWSVAVDTTGFSRGTYKVRAQARDEANNVSTGFSGYTYYGVGEAADVGIDADLNRDGSVNLIDFSILLFWWGGDGGDSDPPADINQDGSVSLTDFSILLFNWTG